MKPQKRTICIELIEDGSRTILGETRISKETFDRLQKLDSQNPKRLRELLKMLADMLQGIVRVGN